jgi:glycosyltransferase involved in cell wall biosynthesis
VPVLANALCGVDEVVANGNSGFIADLATPDKLHAQLEKILAQPEQLVKMGGVARESVHRQFSIVKMIRSYAALYHEVMEPMPANDGIDRRRA